MTNRTSIAIGSKYHRIEKLFLITYMERRYITNGRQPITMIFDDYRALCKEYNNLFAGQTLGTYSIRPERTAAALETKCHRMSKTAFYLGLDKLYSSRVGYLKGGSLGPRRGPAAMVDADKEDEDEEEHHEGEEGDDGNDDEEENKK